MSKGELELFLSFLPDYLVHLKEVRSSLMARIYGIYTVKMEDVAPVSLIMMANSVQVLAKAGIRQSFDLKGSSINRNVKSDTLKGTTTLKDVNLTSMLKLLQKRKPLKKQKGYSGPRKSRVSDIETGFKSMSLSHEGDFEDVKPDLGGYPHALNLMFTEE